MKYGEVLDNVHLEAYDISGAEPVLCGSLNLKSTMMELTIGDDDNSPFILRFSFFDENKSKELVKQCEAFTEGLPNEKYTYDCIIDKPNGECHYLWKAAEYEYGRAYVVFSFERTNWRLEDKSKLSEEFIKRINTYDVCI